MVYFFLAGTQTDIVNHVKHFDFWMSVNGKDLHDKELNYKGTCHKMSIFVFYLTSFQMLP